MEDDLPWKTTFRGRGPSVEDNIRWKMTFSVRQPLVDPCILPSPLCGIFFSCCEPTTMSRDLAQKSKLEV